MALFDFLCFPVFRVFRGFSCALRISNFGFVAVLLPLLFGCKVGPDYHRPAALGTNAVPEAFKEQTGTNHVEWQLASPASHLPRGAWWELFADSELNELETRTAAGNQDLAAAFARFEEARAKVGITRADLLPQIELDPSYVRQRTSLNAPQNGRPAGSSPTYNTFTLALQAGWEVDLWGRVRRQVESARAQLTASTDDLEATKLALEAEVATDYFMLRSLDTEYDLLVRSTETYRRSLELTVNRRRGGIASDLDVSQAQTQLQTTEAELPAISLQRAKLLHALATLCGSPANSFEWRTNSAAQAAPPTIPVYVASELLERRPDVAATEQRMAAANAQIGAAQGAFYPRIRFNGLAGFESVDAATWFDWPSRFWAVGPTLQFPLFTGGRNRAQLLLAKATYNETVAVYRQTVLGAFQEVEDQLAAQRLLAEQLQSETSALSSAQHTLEIANNRYNAGLITYLEVAVAQGSELSIERTVVQLRRERLLAAVGLVRALGGGWEVMATRATK